MASNDRRATARRKTWGRGPTILRFEPLEGRQLPSTAVTTTASAATPTAGAANVIGPAGTDDPASGSGQGSAEAIAAARNLETATATAPAGASAPTPTATDAQTAGHAPSTGASSSAATATDPAPNHPGATDGTIITTNSTTDSAAGSTSAGAPTNSSDTAATAPAPTPAGTAATAPTSTTATATAPTPANTTDTTSPAAPATGASTPTSTGSGTPTTTTTTSTTSGTTPTPGNPAAGLPDLALTTFDTLHNLDWGQDFTATGTVQNKGHGQAPAGIEVDVYASPTPTLGGDAVYVGTAKLDGPIDPGASASFAEKMAAPPVAIAGLNPGATYYLIPKIDPARQLTEEDQVSHGGATGDPTSLVTVTPQAVPKVVATGFQVEPINSPQASWGGTLQVTAQVTNQATGTVSAPTRARVVLVKKGGSPDASEAVTIGELRVPSLPANSPATVRGTIYLTPIAPTSLAGATDFDAYLLTDADYQYRAPLSPSELQGPGRDQVTLTILAPANTPSPPAVKPDLAVAGLQPLTNTVMWSQELPVKATVQNTGSADSGPVRVRFVLADANHPNATPLALADTVLQNVPHNSTTTVTQAIDLQGKLPPGVKPEDVAGRVVVLVDPENTLDQANKANQGLASVLVQVKPLSRDGVSTTTTAPSGTGLDSNPGQNRDPNPAPGAPGAWRLLRGKNLRLHRPQEGLGSRRPAPRTLSLPVQKPSAPRLRVNRPGLRVFPRARGNGPAGPGPKTA